MEINALNETTYVDLFGNSKNPAPPVEGTDQNQGGFQGNTPQDVNLFAKPEVPQGTSEEKPEDKKPEDQKPEDKKPEEGQEGNQEGTGTDILTGNKPGRKPKYGFDDITGYFADRIKTGKFVPVEEEGQDGTKVPFIPKTPEEFDEVIDIQVNYKLEQAKQDLVKSIYQSKSPAWQAVMKYSEMVDDPQELLPFLNTVRTIETVVNINEEDAAGAEDIVRIRLQQRGETDDVIQEQIEVLKGADKLISTAKKYKPLIVAEEKEAMRQMAAEEQDRERQYMATVTDIRSNAIKAIESPIFGKQKLKNEEKAIIYDLIAEPSQETKGYAIYSAIDNLFETKDFETLKQIALFLGKKESFLTYATAAAAQNVSEGLQRKLAAAGSSKSSSAEEGSDTPAVQRKQYSRQGASFGRFEN